MVQRRAFFPPLFPLYLSCFQKVIPVVEQKWSEAKTFFNEEVSPEVQKVYEAAVAGAEKVKEREAQKE